MAYLEMNHVTFSYPQTNAPTLDRVSLEIEEGSFTLVCGPSGCGKSTLLRLLKPEVRPHGLLTGDIWLQGERLTPKNSNEIGFVFQDPENQIVMEEVQYELVFGMENLGYASSIMRRRLAEIAQFFDLESLLHRSTHLLSGGEKQLLNLASVLLMEPKMILLDEPTAQLDPISTRQFLQIIEKLNQEWGLTIILVEHRVEELFSLSDQVLFLKSGQMAYSGKPREVAHILWQEGLHPFIPTVSKMALTLLGEKDVSRLPLDVKEGRSWWMKHCAHYNLPTTQVRENRQKCSPLVELKEVSFRYQYADKNILNHLHLTVQENEIMAVLGRNGSGKSTLLHLLASRITKQRGKMRWHKKCKVALLPQNPRAIFLHDQLMKEFSVLCENNTTSKEELNSYIAYFEIDSLLNKHPLDLSGGEIQRAAIALLCCTNPDLLLLDEPTKGMDPFQKKKLAEILRNLQRKGITIMLVTHDLEFALLIANRCALLFQGEILSVEEPHSFFSDSFFYTSILQRVLRGTSHSHITQWEEFIK